MPKSFHMETMKAESSHSYRDQFCLFYSQISNQCQKDTNPYRFGTDFLMLEKTVRELPSGCHANPS